MVLHFLRDAIGLKDSPHLFIQSEVKPKPIVTRLHAFSRALRQPHVITSSFDWFNVLSVSYVIGQSYSFGFGFTTLKRKPLQHESTNTDDTIFTSLLRNHVGVSNLGLLLVSHRMGCLCRWNPFIFLGGVRRHVAKVLGNSAPARPTDCLSPFLFFLYYTHQTFFLI